MSKRSFADTLGADRARPIWLALQATLVIAAAFAHVWCIATLPMGLYLDESSIGYNAWSIASSGHDEHGVAWPLYFRAFGEYKNPVYIYWLALLYKVGGVSALSTRLASFVCWLAGSALLYALGCRLTRDRGTRTFLLIGLAFTPWLFALSRIAFEVIALLPLLAAYLFAVYRAYEEDAPRWVVLAGLAIGASFYAYSTFRLLAPLHVAIVLACYGKRPYWRRHVVMLVTFAVALLPGAIYLLDESAHLTERFQLLTYLNDATLTPWEKLGAFFDRYLHYFGPSFLLTQGDPNLRHHTGFGGELLIATAVTALGALAVAIAAPQRRFVRLLVAAVLIAPIAAALTVDHGHSLRAFSLVVFALPLSVVGLQWLRERVGAGIVVALLLAAATQAGLYTWNYFASYPAVSALAFQNYGFEQTLRQAVSMSPPRIVISAQVNEPEINIKFFSLLIPVANTIPMVVGSESDVGPDDVFICLDPALDPVHAVDPPRSLYVLRRYADLRASAAR